jgi:HD-GYP domain-containing protein (c-di-GMP phosphodiesterase class II)
MADLQSDSGKSARDLYAAKQLMLETTKTAFQQLSGLLKNITLYPESHPYLISLAEKMLATIQGLLEGRKEVAFYFLNGELFFETNSIPIDENMATMIELFTSRDIEGIVIKPGITMAELIKLASLTSKEPAVLKAEGGIIEAATRENIVNIQFHRAIEIVDKKTENSKQNEEDKKASDLFKEAIESIAEIANNLRMNKKTSMRRLSMAIQAIADGIQDNPDTFMGMINVRMHDKQTFAHLVNTSILAMSIATFLSFEKKQVFELGMAAMLHDIGKVKVPVDIINKNELLTTEEWEEVERHPIDGALINSDFPGLTKMATVTAFEHHQHGNACYPQVDGSSGQHLFSQIISLVDAYEVLTAIQVYYNSSMPCDQVIRILTKKRGSDFNPVLVKALINMIGVFPVGTLIKLSGGEIGLVVHQTSDLMRPRVLLLTKFNGSEKESGEEISLLETSDGKYKRDVIGIINAQMANIDIKQYLE